MKEDAISVLLVEDEVESAHLAQLSLSSAENATFEVDVVQSLADARRMLNEKTFDVIVLDLQLPDSTGGDTVHRIREETSSLPIVILSGSDDDQTIFDAMEKGAQEYLIKSRAGYKLLPRAIEYAAEHKRAEEAVLMSERQLRGFYDNAPDPIIVEDLEGNILDVNPAACALYAMTREELIGRNLLDLLPQEERESATREYHRLNTGELDTYECLCHAKDGRAVPVEICAGCIEYHGKPALLLHVRDVTVRKEREQALEQNRQELEEAVQALKKAQQQMIETERLKALGQMASGIAHDFNNALMPMLGFSGYMLENPDVLENRDEVLHLLQDIHTAAQKAKKVVRRLSEFSKVPDSTAWHVVNMAELVDDVISFTQPSWKEQMASKGITVTVENRVEPSLIMHGNRSQLHEALTNVVLNAAEAMLEDGEIVIRSVQDDGWQCIEIQDNGRGMSEEVRSRCLEPFFTTKGTGASGIGLASSYGIVKQHNGQMEVRSKEDEGTTVILRFPREGRTETAEEMEAKPIAPLNVLVVDDEPTVLTLLRKFLEKDGHAVQTALSGRDGLAEFRNQPSDLVITDQAMPHMNGEQFAEEIKRLSPETPVIMLTGFGDLMKSELRSPTNVDAIITKPISREDLRAALARVVAG